MSAVSKELVRKLVHLAQLLIIGLYIFSRFSFSPRFAMLLLTGVLLLLIEFEYIRIDYQTRWGARITELFSRLFILRKHEKNNVTGAIYFTISTIICFSVFDYPLALLALMMSVFGDLTAALFGIAFGKKKIFRKKSYVGTLCGLVANMFTGVLLLGYAPEIFIPMAFTASAVETLTQKLDDNLTVPLFTGFTGQMLVQILHIHLPQIL